MSYSASQLSCKTQVYAILTSLLNATDSDLGRGVLETTTARIQKDLEQLCVATDEDEPPTIDADLPKVYVRLRLLVRFLGELVVANVVRAEDYACYLDKFLSVCAWVHEDTPRIQAKYAAFKDYFARIVLESILFCAETLKQECESIWTSLLARCTEYVDNRTSSFSEYMSMSVLFSTESVEDLDRISYLWGIIKTDDKIDLSPLRISFEGLEKKLQAGKVHELSRPEMGSSFRLQLEPQRDPILRLLDEDSGEAGAAVAALPKAQWYVSHCSFEDLMDVMHPKMSETAHTMISTAKILSSCLKVQVDYLMFECLLLRMLQVPNDRFKLPFYYGVIFHLIRNGAEFLSPVLGIIVELLFRQIPEMDVEAQDTMAQWFSQFLSTFDLKWPWENWSYVLEAEQDEPQRLFVSNVLERCCRLSYLKYVQKALPESFHALLPPNPSCLSPYSENEQYEEIFGLIKAYEETEKIDEWMKKEGSSIEMLFAAILNAGSATLSHSRLLIEKYRSVLTDACPEDEEQVDLLNVIGRVWQNSPQHVSIMVDIVLKRGIVTLTSIAAWSFTQDNVSQFSWPYLWRILHDTVHCGIQFNQAATDETDKEYWKDQLIKMLEISMNRLFTLLIDAEDPQENWTISTAGRLKQFGRMFRRELDHVLPLLEFKDHPVFEMINATF